jgi:predicted nucleotidyltransferase
MRRRHVTPIRCCSATISGAHLYGFPSHDSDYDLRGIHILPVKEGVGLLPKQETIEFAVVRCGIEMDLVTHDVLKCFTLFLKRNGYVLEQLYPLLIVRTSPEHDAFKPIAAGCITRHHSHHYLGCAGTPWSLFEKEKPPKVKPLLYVYRVLLTGIHLMRTGRVEANFVRLNEDFHWPYVPDLVARKIHGAEKGTPESSEIEFHGQEYESLVARVETDGMQSRLPDELASQDALNDLLVRVRLTPR